MLSGNIRDIAIITVKNVDYRCIINNISKPKAINLLRNVFFRHFFFSLFQMVNIMDRYKSLNKAF